MTGIVTFGGKTTKARIYDMLPSASSMKSLTKKQILARLNAGKKTGVVADATVRGRLSEMVRAGLVGAELLNPNGRHGYYRMTSW